MLTAISLNFDLAEGFFPHSSIRLNARCKRKAVGENFKMKSEKSNEGCKWRGWGKIQREGEGKRELKRM